MDETLKRPEKVVDEEQGQETGLKSKAADSGLPPLQRVSSRTMGPYLSRMGSMLVLPRVGSFKKTSRASDGLQKSAEVGMVAMKGRQVSSGSTSSDDHIGLLEESSEEEFAEQQNQQELQVAHAAVPQSTQDPNQYEISLVETEDNRDGVSLKTAPIL